MAAKVSLSLVAVGSPRHVRDVREIRSYTNVCYLSTGEQRLRLEWGPGTSQLC